MVLENYVILQDRVPARLHFTDHRIDRRTITDPDTGRPGFRNVLVLEVDRLDGRSVAARFSTMASKLADQFAAYLPDKSYRSYDFIITQVGEGFLRRWIVQGVPLVP